MSINDLTEDLKKKLKTFKIQTTPILNITKG